MPFIEVLQYIIMPIVSAIIGGLLTFLGVKHTIAFERNRDNENMVLLNKPYLKISHQKGSENVSCDYIKDTFNQENIDFDKTKFYYSYLIETICLTNSSNADCILREFIIDGIKYSIGNVLFLKNESINLLTTKNYYVNAEKPINNIYIRADDVLGNAYYFECSFKTNYEKMPMEAIYENGKKLSILRITYKITNISLPKSRDEF